MDNSFSKHKWSISPEKESRDYIKDKLNFNPFQNIHYADVKKLGSATITFTLATSFPYTVYNKYKLLYPEDYTFDLEEAIKESGKGLLSGLLSSNYNPPDFETWWQEQYKSDKIPDKGLIVPDTTESHFIQPVGDNLSMLLDFVNISDTAGMLLWVTKYGPLSNYHSEKYSCAQDIERFVSELTILKTLYCLFTAVNKYAEGEKEPLNSYIKLTKMSTYAEKLELKIETSLFHTEKFWGYNYSNYYNLKISKDTVNNLKKKSGYLLLVGDIPTPTYFETSKITDDTLPIKVLEFIAHMIDYKTCYETKKGVLVNSYSLRSAGVQVNNPNAPSIYQLTPTIACSDHLVLMYFQLLWLISTDGAKPCKKCGQYFLPQGERPGKQKYCGHCGKHAAQDQYKKRTLEAIKAYKLGFPLEEAALKHNITAKRLEKALRDGV